MDRDRMHCIASVAVVMGALLACKPKATADHDAGPTDEQRAQALCERLVTAGVAKRCWAPVWIDDPHYVQVNFDIVGGFPDDLGSAQYWPNPDDFKLADGAAGDYDAGISADEYPLLSVTSNKTRLTVDWSNANWPDAGEFIGGDNTPWEKCRGVRFAGTPKMTEKKSVAACAKLHPKEYAAYRALYEAAKKATEAM